MNNQPIELGIPLVSWTYHLLPAHFTDKQHTQQLSSQLKQGRNKRWPGAAGVDAGLNSDVDV